MNILRTLFEENSQSIDTADLEVRELAGEALGIALLDVAPNFFESGIDEGLFFDQVASAYMPIVDYKRWDIAEAEVEAEAREPEMLRDLYPTSDDPTLEWTTFVRGSSWRGALVPEDNGGEEVVSVFTRFGGLRRALRFFRRGRDIHASVNLNHHCGYPDLSGRCEPGRCGGCESRRLVVPPRGIICLCGHS